MLQTLNLQGQQVVRELRGLVEGEKAVVQSATLHTKATPYYAMISARAHQMDFHMNLEQEKSAIPSLLEKTVPHRNYHWKSLESMTNASICSSEVSRSTQAPLDQFESCWQPSKNYRGGLVKGHGNSLSKSKP
jgi:hypothetical protein